MRAGSEVRVAVDVGGTFTDIALMADNGVLHESKISTTPDDPSIAVVDGLIALLDSLHVPAAVWMFSRGLPVKYTGPAMNAAQGAVAIEALEIAHEGVFQLPFIGVASGVAGAIKGSSGAAGSLLGAGGGAVSQTRNLL